MISLFSNLITLLRLLFKLIRYNTFHQSFFFKITHLSANCFENFFSTNRSFDNHNWGERLVYCFIALGPSFIKFGQALATRADIIGRDTP